MHKGKEQPLELLRLVLARELLLIGNGLVSKTIGLPLVVLRYDKTLDFIGVR